MSKELVKKEEHAIGVFGNPIVEALNQPTPEGRVKYQPPEAGGFAYVDSTYVRERLDAVFGGAWSFQAELASPEALKLGEVVMKGTLTIHVGPDQAIVKEQYGSAKIKWLRSDPTKPVDIGNDFKAATSDALKKCASLLGIAGDVYSGKFGKVDREGRVVGAKGPTGQSGPKPQPVQAQAAAKSVTPKNPTAVRTDKQIGLIKYKAKEKGIDLTAVQAYTEATFGQTLDDLTMSNVPPVIDWLAAQPIGGGNA